MSKHSFWWYFIGILVIFFTGYWTGVRVQPKVDQRVDRLKSNYKQITKGVLNNDTTDIDSTTITKVDKVDAPLHTDTIYLGEFSEALDGDVIYSAISNNVIGSFYYNKATKVCLVFGYNINSGKAFKCKMTNIDESEIENENTRSALIYHISLQKDAYVDGIYSYDTTMLSESTTAQVLQKTLRIGSGYVKDSVTLN